MNAPHKMKERRKAKEKADSGAQLVPLRASPAKLLSAEDRESLASWFSLYMGLEGSAGSDHTARAKRRDLQAFLDFFAKVTGSDEPDLWTRSLTSDFLKYLERGVRKSPTTINRMLATLRHAAGWVHGQRPFLAGNPCDRVQDLQLDDPEWKGLSEIEVTRLRAAAEQLLHLKKRRNQLPLRDRALFLLLLHTGLRVSELVALDLAQYQGKHLTNVKRKGKKVSAKVFLTKETREVLDQYLKEMRGEVSGPLFCSRVGRRLFRENVDDVLKGIADHANARLPGDQRIHLSAHVLRHTMLRRTAERYGVQYAMEVAGHTSSQYIWRYVRPTDEEKEKAIEELF